MLYQNNQQYLESLDKIKNLKKKVKQLEYDKAQEKSLRKQLQEQIQGISKNYKVDVQKQCFDQQTQTDLDCLRCCQQQQEQKQKDDQNVSKIDQSANGKSNQISNSLVAKLLVQKYTLAAQLSILKNKFQQVSSNNNSLRQQIKNQKIYHKKQKSRQKSRSKVIEKDSQEISMETKREQNDTILKAQKIIKMMDNSIGQQEQNVERQLQQKRFRSHSQVSKTSQFITDQFSDLSVSRLQTIEYSFRSDAEILTPLKNFICNDLKEQDSELKNEVIMLKQQLQNQNAEIKKSQEKIKLYIEEIQILQDENQQLQEQKKQLENKNPSPQFGANKHIEISFSHDFSCDVQEQEERIKQQQSQIVLYISKNSKLKSELASLKVTYNNSKIQISKLNNKILQLEQENQNLKRRQ